MHEVKFNFENFTHVWCDCAVICITAFRKLWKFVWSKITSRHAFSPRKKPYSVVTTLLNFIFMTLSQINITGLNLKQNSYRFYCWIFFCRIASVDWLAWRESSSKRSFRQSQNKKLSRNAHLFVYVSLLRLNNVCEDWRPCQRRYRRLDSNFVWSNSHLRFRVFSSTLVKSRFMISSPSVDVCLFKLRKADFKQLLICLSFNDVVLE